MAKIRRDAIVGLVHENWGSWQRSTKRARFLDTWHRGTTDPLDSETGLFVPENQVTSDEYQDLAKRAPTPWLGLVVTAIAQTCFLDGVRRSDSADNLKAWTAWQENRMDDRQSPLYRAAFAHGESFMVGVPGVAALTGKKMTKMKGFAATRMAAFYDDDDDEWPMFTITGDPVPLKRGEYTVTVHDDVAIHYLSCVNEGYELKDWTYISYEEHPAGVTPVVRYANLLDLEGRTTGEVEPFIPLARRIDQDTFDRLIVQRFGAWKVRYVAGMAKPPSGEDAVALQLRLSDLLVSTDSSTKFGTLDATDLAGFIASRDADLRDLSAVSQTPPHHLLGLSSNLQAEALAAAEAGLQRKSAERRTGFGESHEQLFRLTAKINGDLDEAGAVDMQVRWRDTESRSFVQTAQALGQLATQLKIPVEMLWDKVPGWTDIDTERAKQIVQDQDGVDALLAAVASSLQPAAPAQQPGQQQQAVDTPPPAA